MMHQPIQSQLDIQLPSKNHSEAVDPVSDKQITAEHGIPLITQHTAHQHVGTHQKPTDDHHQHQHWYPIDAHHSLVDMAKNTTHKTSWEFPNQPQLVATKQEIMKRNDYKCHISTDTANSTAYQSATAQQPVSTETHEVSCHRSSSLQQIQLHQSLTEMQQISYEVTDNEQLAKQVMTKVKETAQQAKAPTQQTLLESQQVPVEAETVLQTTVEAQQVPTQNDCHLPVKLYEVKEVKEIQQISTEGEEQECSVSTELQQVALVDTQVPVMTQASILYQPHVEQSSTADTLTCNPVKIRQEEIQEERKHQLAVVTQQTPTAFDQTTFQISKEAQQTTGDDEQMQCQSSYNNHPNIQRTSTEAQHEVVVNIKQEITETTDTVQMPTNRMDQSLLEAQKISHQLAGEITSTETLQAKTQNDPQQMLQPSDARSGDTCTVQQLNSDEPQNMHHMVDDSINQKIETNRITTNVEQIFSEIQEVTQHHPPYMEQTIVEHQQQLQSQQPVETPGEIVNPQGKVIITQEITPYKTAYVSMHEDQVITHQLSDYSQQEEQPVNRILIEAKDTEQSYQHDDQLVNTMETSVEIQKARHQHQLMVEMEQTALTTVDYHPMLPASAHDIVHHSPHEIYHKLNVFDKEGSVEISQTLNEVETKYKTHQLSDEIKQIQWPVETEETPTDNAQVTTSIQESLQLVCKTHDGVNDQQATDRLPLTVQPTSDETDTAKQQLPLENEQILLEQCEPQETSCQLLQQVSFEMPQQLQVERLLDKTNDIADHPATPETQQVSPTSSQQLLFESTKATRQNLVEFQQTFNAKEPSQLVINTEEEMEKSQNAAHQSLTESTTALPVTDEKIVYQPKQTTADACQIFTEPYQVIQQLPAEALKAVSDHQQMTEYCPVDTQLMLDEAHTVKHQRQLLVGKIEHRQPQLEDTLGKGHEIVEQPVDEILIESKDHLVTAMNVSVEKAEDQANQLMVEMEQTMFKNIDRHLPAETQSGLNELTCEDIAVDTQQTSPEMQEILHTSVESEKIPNQQFPKVPQELNEPQSVILYNKELMLASAQDGVHHSSFEITQEASVETHRPFDEKCFNTQQLSDETKQIQWPVETEETPTDNAQAITSVQESLQLVCKTHDGVNDQQATDRLPLTVQPTSDETDTTKQQLPLGNEQILLEKYEPQETSCQLLQQVSFEMPQQLQVERLYETNDIVDHPATPETQQVSPTSSQQLLFESTKATRQNLVEFQQTVNAKEPSQLVINMQDQTANKPQQIISHSSKDTEGSRETFEECVSIRTDVASQIPIGTTPPIMPEAMHSQLVETQQEASANGPHILTRKAQEATSLCMSSNIQDAAIDKEQSGDDQNTDHFPVITNQLSTESHKPTNSPFEVQELTIEDKSISCQSTVKAEPVLNTAPSTTEQTAIMQAFLPPLETKHGILHEIVIDYMQSTVSTRKSFYHIPTVDDEPPHLFLTEAKQTFSEQLQPQKVTLKTQEVTYQTPDETQSLVENRQPEKEQILVVPQPDPLHAPNDMAETQEVIATIQTPTETHGDRQIRYPMQTQTLQGSTDPQPVECEEDVMVIDFTDSNQVTEENFNIVTIIPSDRIWQHHQLHVDENVTSIGEVISTCTFRCCSYHILIKIEKISQKKRLNTPLSSTIQYQSDPQNTREVIDKLLLKYL